MSAAVDPSAMIKCDMIAITMCYILKYRKNGPTEKTPSADGSVFTRFYRVEFAFREPEKSLQTNDFELGTVLRAGSKLFDATMQFRLQNTAAIVFTKTRGPIRAVQLYKFLFRLRASKIDIYKITDARCACENGNKSSGGADDDMI